LTPVNAPSFTSSPLMYNAHRSGAIVKAMCIQPLAGSTSAAVLPSIQVSATPLPTFSLMRCIPAAPGSRNRRNPLVRLLLVGPGGLTVNIPAWVVMGSILYQKDALNASLVRSAIGSVRYASAAPLYARPDLPAAKPGLPTLVALILPSRSR